ncbi:3413_t:CDS:1, partial [Funneliformis mosseae]
MPTYHDLPHDEFLVIKICKGLRPKFKRKVPQLLKQMINRCLDANPLARPTAGELCIIFQNWINEVLSKRDAEFAMQYNEVVELNENIEPNTISSPQAVYISRLLDFDNLPEPQNSKLINNEFHLVSETL